MPSTFKSLLLIIASLLLGACIGSGSVNIPSDHYYRLPSVTSVQASDKPLLSGSLAIQAPVAHGMLHERTILFIREQQPLEVNPYHYHHWVNTPASMIQLHMLEYFRNRNFASKVIRYRADVPTDYSIRSELFQFERHIQSSGIKVQVSIELALLQNGKEIYRQRYTRTISATGKDMPQTITAFGSALEQIYQQFIEVIKMTVTRF